MVPYRKTGINNMINNDFRNIENGNVIPSESGYCDQPSLIKARDGSFLCALTTGRGREGGRGEYVAVIKSRDNGISWGEPALMESPEYESSYAYSAFTATISTGLSRGNAVFGVSISAGISALNTATTAVKAGRPVARYL